MTSVSILYLLEMRLLQTLILLSVRSQLSSGELSLGSRDMYGEWNNIRKVHFASKVKKRKVTRKILDLKTALLKFNCFLATTVATHCTLKSSPWWFIDYCNTTSLDQHKLYYCTIALRPLSRCEIYDYAIVLIWKFAWDMPMNDKKRKRVSRY